MKECSPRKKNVIAQMDALAPQREQYLRRNRYYYRDLEKFFRFTIPENSSVLEIGCGVGNILHAVKPRRGVGIDISSGMVDNARRRYPQPELTFIQMDAEAVSLEETFEYVIISDTLSYFEDIQAVFSRISRNITPDTRVIITYHNFLWEPLFRGAELLQLKMPHLRLNWLNRHDITNLLQVEGYEVVKSGKRFLCPKFIPLVSWLLNTFAAHLPFINNWCVTGYVVARAARTERAAAPKNVSVIIPARNEKGNIEEAVRRVPKLGATTEIIFVEGNSSDGTREEIRRVCEKYGQSHNVKYFVQDGKGKADAVRKGFAMASGELLIILDADLTVMPEDLPKFIEALASGHGEFINGSRLVYPMEKEAMKLLNILGNKLFSMAFSWLLEQRIKDTLCGTKAISREHWNKLAANRAYFGDFDPFGDFDLIFGAAKHNLKMVEIPVRYQARAYGDTNISRFRNGWTLLKMTLFAMNKLKFI
jgi:SAM-dependent methyltransferase